MRHFMFMDYDTNEDFIVGAKNKKEAMEFAKNIFADPAFICEVSEMEAEMSGLDEY